MNAMILAAGRGERMRPLTDSVPKPLLEVGGKPLIYYHLENLAAAGFRHVVINVSWLAEMIMEKVGDGQAFGINIEYSHEPEALETAGGIVQALDKLDDEFVVVNGDTFTDPNFAALPMPSGQAHLVLVDNPEHHPTGDFAIREGLLRNEGDCLLTFSGIATYRKSFFAGLVAGKRALAPMLRAGAEHGVISAEHFRGYWSDVGTPQRLQSIQSLAGVE